MTSPEQYPRYPGRLHLEPEENELLNLSPAEQFRRAKVEHYLAQAAELVQMARYKAAGALVETARALDPENAGCREIEQTITQQMYNVEHRRNGYAHLDAEEILHSERRKRTELVLVVDQDERILKSLTATLRRYSFHVMGAAGYEEAVETIATIPPDAVISEVNFESGPRGFELYNLVKTSSTLADVPFLFLATRIDREVLIAGKRFGVDDFIQKPVDDEVVAASLVNCLARKRPIPQNVESFRAQ